MSCKWYDTGIFYHIYPLGLTGAPERNDYGAPVHRLRDLWPWVDHLTALGCNGLYIGPLFESGTHGYDTTDYLTLDRRLGTNEDLKDFVAYCHEKGVKVLFDGVFNHVGRDFFAFQDLKAHREGSRYRDWFCNVNFWGNNEYNDGFSYDNWGGFNLLVKLNQHNGEVQNYIREVIFHWVREFDVDGLRLDAADVLDFGFMNMLRRTADEVKPDFWLMGEVIHGEYSRWVNREHLHCVTNYHLHKALFSGHNDHNYFEIAHTVKRIYDMDRSRPEGLKLYNFVDNHDVERIATKLRNSAHFAPVHVLLYTLPGVPSLYYGSEFGIQGRKERGSDASLRPALKLSDFPDALENNPCTRLIARLGQVRERSAALSCGDYNQLLLTTRQYAFSRTLGEETVLVLVNNDDSPFTTRLPAQGDYVAALSGQALHADNGTLEVTAAANSGEIYLPAQQAEGGKWESIVFELPEPTAEEIAQGASAAPAAPAVKMAERVPAGKSYEEMTVEELQRVIYDKMAANGPVTDQMQRSIEENTHHGSLINWARSFR
jgi:glycosidase